VSATFASSGTATSTGIVVPSNETDTLNIAAAAGSPKGSYTINLSGTDGSGNTATAQIAVNITAGFTLTATPANVTIPPGGSVSAAIVAIAAGTESGSVTLADRPTIAGLTLALSPSSVGIGNGSTSTATLSLGSSVLPGTTFTATVTGTDSSGDKSSVDINVTVGTPSFSVSVSPIAVSANAGDTNGTTCAVSVLPTSSFADTVNLSGAVSGQPGISIAFAPAAVSINPSGSGAASIATITASSAVPPGPYSATITGSVGEVTASAPLQITVNAASSTTISVGNAGGWGAPVAGVQFTGNVTATFSPALLPTDTVTYNWASGQVWRAWPHPGTLHFKPYNGAPPSWPLDSAAATPTFDATFNQAGYYIIQVNVQATITHENMSTTVVNGTGYIGGSQSDVQWAGGAASADVRQAQGAEHAMDESGNAMLQIRAAGQAVSITAIFIKSGATKMSEPTDVNYNWVAVKSRGTAIVTAIVSPNTAAARSQIVWVGAQANPTNNAQATVSLAKSSMIKVSASTGGSTKTLNLWVIWGVYEMKFKGQTDPGQICDIQDRDTVLGPPHGAGIWRPDMGGGDTLGPINAYQTEHFTYGTAGYLMQGVCTLTPPGAGVVLGPGVCHMSRKRSYTYWFTTWQNAIVHGASVVKDHSYGFDADTDPSLDNKLYDADCPEITIDANETAEVYNQFVASASVTLNKNVYQICDPIRYYSEYQVDQTEAGRAVLNSAGLGPLPQLPNFLPDGLPTGPRSWR
jgi:hypothetical protein